MKQNAIALRDINKCFRVPLDRSTTLKYKFTHPRSTSRYRELHAVRGITCDIPHGQFLGITGPNGCGKSTLLKILSRIYKPDSGSMSIQGRVSPFLELGVGFNSELTARENVFLGGAVLGLTRAELRERVDRIISFADLEDCADQKLKNFSSGMQVRLAFSVAIQADAGILLMDEVLAVGDARFQEKCFDIFSRYKREGRTIVLVSHDLGAITNYCDRALLMDHGQIIDDGNPTEVTAHYRRNIGADSDRTATAIEGSTNVAPSRWGTQEVEVVGVRLLGPDGTPHQTVYTGQPFTVEVDFAVRTSVPEVVCGLAFRRSDGNTLSGPNSRTGGHPIRLSPEVKTGTVRYVVPDNPLLGGSYLLTAAIYDEHAARALDHVEDVLAFRVADEEGRLGFVDLGGRWDHTASSIDTMAHSALSTSQ